MKRKAVRWTVLALALGPVGFCLPSVLASADPPTEVGFLVGGGVSDGTLEGRAERGLGSVGPVVGVRAAHLFGAHVSWFGDGTTARYGTQLASDDFQLSTLRTGIEYLFQPGESFRWFVSGAGGWAKADYAAPFDFDRPMLSAGIGQRFRVLGGGSYFRWELRVDRLLGSSGFDGAALMNGQLLAGWSLAFGSARMDSDQDGVLDRPDACPGTPLGVRVDTAGCPLDGDGDGVPDGLDACPDSGKTPNVDAAGCPPDADQDGVPDGSDRCADTPLGAKVDAPGCPIDLDGDTVPDGIDRCPDTPAIVMIGPDGCPLDFDGDGVPNGIDRCLETPKGTKVDATGCPLPRA